MKSTLVAAAFVAVLAAPDLAKAGDAATLDILGFSADGGIFAFEEYGIQDGSGFPYANRFYIETATDSFVHATPIRVRLDTESATVVEARDQVRARGHKVIEDLVLEAHSGFTVGANAITELSADQSRMTVSPRPVFPPIDKPIAFRLELTPAESPPECKGHGAIVGFRLTRAEEGGAPEIIHADQTIPASRNCPLDYSIAAIQTFYPENGAPVFGVVIAITSVGFEGPNHRFIAVTGRL